MCDEHRPSDEAVARVAPRPAAEPTAEPIAREPVDRVVPTTLVDNLSDMLLLDRGPAKRFGALSMSNGPWLWRMTAM
jgi:hypothetical protein